MTLWTIQTKEVWETLINNEVYWASENFIFNEFNLPYQYMIKQMHNQLKVKAQENTYPIWAWYQYTDEKKRKPDLRYSGYLERGTQGVLIEFEIDESEVLLSDFDLWHYVLNYWYLPESEIDSDNFDKEIERAGLKYPLTASLKSKYFRNKIEESWSKIFNINWCDEDFYIAKSRAKKSIQATFWELKLKQVTKVKFFTAK